MPLLFLLDKNRRNFDYMLENRRNYDYNKIKTLILKGVMNMARRKAIKNMNRDEVIKFAFDTAIKSLKKGVLDCEYDQIFELAIEWNRTHEDESELFVCELANDDRRVIGIMIEDDPIYFEN